jgi:hypothetical protein
MYLAIGTRRDIAYSVQRLAQFTQNPKPIHWTAVKCIFQYLKGTRTSGLTYGGSDEDLNDEELNIYCGADWASDADRKSVSSYVITLAGGAVAWSSKKQTTVALSTAEAEYVAATHCAKQVFGTDPYSRKSESPYHRLRQFSRTIKPRFRLHIIQNTTHE